MVRKTALLAVVLVLTLVGSAVTLGAVAQEQQEAGNQADDAVDAQDRSHLRVAHAVADEGAVDVTVGNDTVASNVDFGEVSNYLDVSSGERNVTITAANESDAANDTDDVDPVFEGNVSVDTPVNTLVIYEEADQLGDAELQTMVLEDDARTPGEDDSAVRAVNLAPDGPDVNVTVSADGAAADTGATGDDVGADDADDATGADDTEDNATGADDTDNATGADGVGDDAGADDTEDNATGAEGQQTIVTDRLSVNASSGYVTVPAGDEVTVEVSDENDVDDPTIATTDTSLEGESAYTVWIIPAEDDGATGAGEVQAVLTQDATITVELPDDAGDQTTPDAAGETETPGDEGVTDTPEEDGTPEDAGETETPEDEGETETPEETGTPEEAAETGTPEEDDETETPGDEGETETPGEDGTPEDAGETETPEDEGDGVGDDAGDDAGDGVGDDAGDGVGDNETE